MYDVTNATLLNVICLYPGIYIYLMFCDTADVELEQVICVEKVTYKLASSGDVLFGTGDLY